MSSQNNTQITKSIDTDLSFLMCAGRDASIGRHYGQRYVLFKTFSGIKLLNFSQVAELHVFLIFLGTQCETLESDLHRCIVHTAASEVNERCGVNT